ncbi:hybrid sensor histidine kinase/response regulator [Salinimonas chungwhensis]|uniref:hybrid sensor histidine kinase/response regulator n=1 Tax=Salinimonas chungwhensis TaxID=265425 RepID=UPI0003762777|nr:hybrid sensor histidine kinase/response regulator [Salinimonas chungwhensis]
MRVASFLWFIITVALSSVGAQAQTTIQLFDEDASVDLSSNFAIYRETGIPLTIGEVLERKRQFQWYTEKNPNFGFRENGMWLSTRISNVSNLSNWIFTIDFSQLDKVDFYLVSGDKVILQSHQGKLQSEQRFRVPTLRADLPVATPLELFLRVQSHSSSLIVPLKVTPEPIHSTIWQIDSTMWGLFYGGLIILAIYNLVLFFQVREASLLAYVCYVIAVIFWQLIWGGHIQAFSAGPTPAWLASHTELMFVFVGMSSGMFSILFLNTKKNAPTAHPIVIAMLGLQAFVGLICLLHLLPVTWKHNLVYGAGMAGVCSYIYAGFEAFFNRFEPARYFIFAWTMLSAGAIAGMLSLMGLLPSNQFITYCFQVGVFLESALFSVALIQKSRTQLETEVQQATDDLRNNMELIEEQNARLDIARKDAIKASNVKSQFLANMSHEIRTPLNAILGFSRELGNAPLPADQQEQVRIVNTAADNLLSIVNDVLDFSKIEAGKLQINNQPFSPIKEIEELVTIMSKSAHSKRLEFVFDMDPLPEKLIGDLFRIKQVLNNLLSNALKFTSSGSVALRVKNKALAHGLQEIEFVIEDTGIGISRQDRKKLFSAFSQLDDSTNRSYQGTGLGLVICRELVRLMRGEMKLRSDPGLGSIFTINLKMNRLSHKYAMAATNRWKDKHVVIFDPVPATRRATAAMLCNLGAQVTSAESLRFLKRLDLKPDYLFATLPVSKLNYRDAMLSELVQIPAERRVLWYSGADPINQYPSLAQHFYSKIRMPATLTKLEDLLYHKASDLKNPLQSKLDSLPHARVLAVDDMEMNLKLLQTWLRTSPLTLTTSTSGADAVNRCETTEFDIILMDVQMPGMDGLQATKRIRKTALNMGTPIIAVTAHAFKEEQERLLASGMDDYLPKPINQASLVEIIRRWCQSNAPPCQSKSTLDWDLAVERTNRDDDTARELLADFVRLLPDSIRQIKAGWEDSDFGEMQNEVHRLHGACCYTGVPKLQQLAHDLESALKRDKKMLVAELLPVFLEEAVEVISEADVWLDRSRPLPSQVSD